MGNIWHSIVSFLKQYFTITSISVIDIIEIIIIAFFFYEIMKWFKKTRAWSLFKGIVVILLIVLLASIFQFNTISWIAGKTISVGIIGVLIIFQPELRRALEQIGKGKAFKSLFGVGKDRLRISDKNLEEIINAVMAMSSVHTGALICLEKDIALGEYENTGIVLNSEISRQLIMNIFENKTPLHDGAVIIKDDLIAAATCYLPMSDNLALNKKYGTRHRAAVGLSEVTDAMIIIVSEETGNVSIANNGVLYEDISEATLKNKMIEFQKSHNESGIINRLRKEKQNEDKADSSEVGNK